MYATLLATALAVGQPPTGNDRPGAQPGATPGASAADRPGAAGNASLDGNWTVVSLERNGHPVPNAQNMTVTVRGNTVTFDAGKATGQPVGGQGQMRAMRLDFGADGRVYVTEAGADGKFGTGGATPGAGGTGTTPGAGGSDRPGGTAGVDRPSTPDERRDATGAGSSTGTARPGTGAGAGTAGAGGTAGTIPAGSKSGVYILTQDYFAVSIHEENRPGASPGLDRPGTGTDRPGTGGTGTDRPGAGADRPTPGVTPGGSVVGDPAGGATPGAARPTGGSDRPGATPAAPPTDRPGAGGTGTGTSAAGRAGMAGGMVPQNRSYVTVILKRGGSTPPK